MTYAIFRAAGFQYRAELGDVLRLPSLEAESGETVTFDQVLLGASGDDVLIGRPTLDGAAVRAEVLGHGRADKIVVFKFKRRKNYRRKTGHRQDFTEVRVNQIDLGGDRVVTWEPEKKPEKKPKKKPAAKKEPEAKTATKKKSAATKPTAKAKSTAKAKTTTKAKAKSTTRSKKKKP